MGVYEDLQARGLIAQVTDEARVRDLVNTGKAVFYIGFDPTADSLHVGHFMALCLMKRLQMAGNKPIALIGGGTAMIGDPSGRSDMRQMMTKETIDHNCAFSTVPMLNPFLSTFRVEEKLPKPNHTRNAIRTAPPAIHAQYLRGTRYFFFSILMSIVVYLIKFSPW